MISKAPSQVWKGAVHTSTGNSGRHKEMGEQNTEFTGQLFTEKLPPTPFCNTGRRNMMNISDLVKMQSLLGPERRMEGNSNVPVDAPSMRPHRRISRDTVSSPLSLGELGTVE